MFSSFALFSCQFAEQRRSSQGLGLIFSEREDALGNYQCVESVSDYSSSWLYKWALVCGCLGPIFGIAIFILMLFDCCCKVCCSKIMQGFLFFAAIFSQGCTFLIYLSSPCYFNGNGFTCKVGWGTVWSIIAFSSYFIASLFLCFSPKHDPSTCCYDDDTKEAAKQYDEEQPAPAEQKAAEATVVAAAAVVQEDKKQPEDAEARVGEPQAVEEKQVDEETPVAAAVTVKEEAVEESSVAASAASVKEDAAEEPSVVASVASVKEEAVKEPEEEAGQEVEVDDLDDGVKVSVKEDGISTRLEPSVTGTAPDPDDLEDHAHEDPDGEKFVGESIKANLSMKTSPW